MSSGTSTLYSRAISSSMSDTHSHTFTVLPLAPTIGTPRSDCLGEHNASQYLWRRQFWEHHPPGRYPARQTSLSTLLPSPATAAPLFTNTSISSTTTSAFYTSAGSYGTPTIPAATPGSYFVVSSSNPTNASPASTSNSNVVISTQPTRSSPSMPTSTDSDPTIIPLPIPAASAAGRAHLTNGAAAGIAVGTCVVVFCLVSALFWQLYLKCSKLRPMSTHTDPFTGTFCRERRHWP